MSVPSEAPVYSNRLRLMLINAPEPRRGAIDSAIEKLRENLRRPGAMVTGVCRFKAPPLAGRTVRQFVDKFIVETWPQPLGDGLMANSDGLPCGDYTEHYHAVIVDISADDNSAQVAHGLALFRDAVTAAGGSIEDQRDWAGDVDSDGVVLAFTSNFVQRNWPQT